MDPNSGVEIKTIVKQGHLKKLGGERKNWKERLVILGERRIAYYDDSDPAKKILKGEFYLRKEMKVEELKDTKDGAGFSIFIEEKKEEENAEEKKEKKEEERVWQFVMCDGEDNAAWISAVQGVLDKIKELPESHYFIPNLQPTNAKVFGFNLPKGFPSFLVGMIPGSKPENIAINNDIFRPEELVEWVDDASMEGLYNPVKHVRVPEYKCREHEWGEGVSHFLKFDLLLAKFIKKASRNIRARMESTDGKIPADAIVTQDEMNNLYCEISVEFGRATSELEAHAKDAASAELGLDYLWDDVKAEGPFDKQWRAWINRFQVFQQFVDNTYKFGDVDFSILMTMNFDKIIERYKEYKEENVKLVQGGASYQDMCSKKTKVFDIIVLPYSSTWPDNIGAFNNEMQAILPSMTYLSMMNFCLFGIAKDYPEKKDENLEVYNYFDLIFTRHREFMNNLRQEVYDGFIRVTAPLCLKDQCRNFVDAFKTGYPEMTDEEYKNLLEKMEANAK
jgi:hypothetical protein